MSVHLFQCDTKTFLIAVHTTWDVQTLYSKTGRENLSSPSQNLAKVYELNVFTKWGIKTQFDGPLRMNFDAVDMGKYLNYGLNYKIHFA